MIKRSTVGQLLAAAYDILKNVDIDTYMIDSQLLMAKALNKDKLFVLMNRDKEVNSDEENIFKEYVEQRRNKVPVKYILKECEFMGLDFFVKSGVLIPRPDTEILVEEVIKKICDRGYSYVCDVCSGSGAIGVSIANFIENVEVECYDISEIAEEVNKINIEKLSLEDRVKFFKSDLLYEAISNSKQFDVVVSNPPYIRDEVIPTLMEDVREHEPYIALSGGCDGLDFYRSITKQSRFCLKDNGMLAFEIGHDQKYEVISIMESNGFEEIICIQDLAGNDRVIIGIKKSNVANA